MSNAWNQDRPPEDFDRWRVVEVTNWQEYQAEIRRDLAMMLEEELRPLLRKREHEGGYNCCGCSTYGEILDHAIRIVKGEDRDRA